MFFFYVSTVKLILYFKFVVIMAGNIEYKSSSSSANKSDEMSSSSNGKQILFKCSTCFNVFKNIGDFQTHLQTHARPRNFNCVVCNKSYFKNFHLMQHLKTYSDPLFNCDECPKKFHEKRNHSSSSSSHR